MVTDLKWETPASLLKLDKVSKVYGEGDTEVTALHPITLNVREGNSLVLLDHLDQVKVHYFPLREHFISF